MTMADTSTDTQVVELEGGIKDSYVIDEN